MASHSIARHIYRAILAVSSVSIFIMITAVLVVNEDLEKTMLMEAFNQERDYIIQSSKEDYLLMWDTPNLAILYVPDGHPTPANIPSVFQELPESGFSGEIKTGNETHLVSIRRTDHGLFYIAKNITHFEEREAHFNIALLFTALAIFGFSLVLAKVGSKHVIQPLKELSEKISKIPAGRHMPRLASHDLDTELQAIAITLNHFLDELEAYVQREKLLISLASHELRTPIAVISGAMDVIEARGQLNADDAVTFKRIRQSCDEMRDNVETLLRLSRRDPEINPPPLIDLHSVLQEVMDDLKVSHDAANRLRLLVKSKTSVHADPTMVRMLLRNLIQNAIQHTRKEVQITLTNEAIEIADQGPGLDTSLREVLQGERTPSIDSGSPGGLGLYIVTLMTTRLGWRITVGEAHHHGTLTRVVFRDIAIP